MEMGTSINHATDDLLSGPRSHLATLIGTHLHAPASGSQQFIAGVSPDWIRWLVNYPWIHSPRYWPDWILTSCSQAETCARIHPIVPEISWDSLRHLFAARSAISTSCIARWLLIFGVNESKWRAQAEAFAGARLQPTTDQRDD